MWQDLWIILGNWLMLIGQALDTSNHLKIGIEKGKPFFSVQNHWDFVENLKQELDKARKTLEPGEYLETIFKVTRDCDYVTLSSSDRRFMQFTRKGGLLFDYPMLESNDLRKLKTKTLKLLHQYRFKKHTKGSTLMVMEYEYLKIEEGKTLQANFGKNTELFKKFTKDIFINIFKTGLKNIYVGLG
jgi:hypothetical protein